MRLLAKSSSPMCGGRGARVEEHRLVLGPGVGKLRLVVKQRECGRDVRAEAAARHSFVGIRLDQDDVRCPPEHGRLDRASMGKAAVDDLRGLSGSRKVMEHPRGKHRVDRAGADERIQEQARDGSPAQRRERRTRAVRSCGRRRPRNRGPSGRSIPRSPRTEPVSTRSRASRPSPMIWRLNTSRASPCVVRSLGRGRADEDRPSALPFAATSREKRSRRVRSMPEPWESVGS